ncbi:MAG TPA: hypothetical protein ENI23_17300 [bacterium]|nr:hypothetical protein [bacterium]
MKKLKFRAADDFDSRFLKAVDKHKKVEIVKEMQELFTGAWFLKKGSAYAYQTLINTTSVSGEELVVLAKKLIARLGLKRRVDEVLKAIESKGEFLG